ncbi:hypothetical protein [Photobacterium damselae]|uniref:hypothetical protein n=1 Tax=Photobacterium damselae TaxID=38293 RepID=UPI0040696478
MASKNRVQVMCDDTLYKRLEAEKERTQAPSISDVGRELWNFALTIKERASEDKSRTVKEMLEEILMKEYQNETTINQIFLQVLDPNNRIESSKVDIVKNKLKSYKEEAQVRTEQFIDGKE